MKTKRQQVETKRQPSMSKETLRAHLESMFPEREKLISRRNPLLNKITAWGTLANADSEGNGIKERVVIGNKIFYERMATINWLVDRCKE